VELGKQFELSKESVRKALDVLVEEGRIEKSSASATASSALC